MTLRAARLVLLLVIPHPERKRLGGSCVATDAEPKPASGVTASVIVGVVDGTQTVGAGVAEEVILDVHTDQPVLV